MNDEKTGSSTTYRKSSIKPPEGLFISSPFEWGAGGGGLMDALGLFSLETTMVSVLHKELEYKVEKLKYKKFRSCSRGSESNPTFQLVNKTAQISLHEVLQSWLINKVHHLLVKNN